MIFKTNSYFSDKEAQEKIRTLIIQSQQLMVIHERLSKRDASMVKNCVEALTTQQKELAEIYSNETSKIRRIMDFLDKNIIIIECITVRLETYIEFNNFLVDLKPVLNVIQDVSGRLVDYMPQVSAEIQLMNSTLCDVLTNTKANIPSTSEIVRPVTKEGENIMKEALSMMEERLMSQMPEPPTLVEESAKKLNLLEEDAIALKTAAHYDDGEENDTQFYIPDVFNDVLLEYLKGCGGTINLSKCSNDLNLTYDEIRRRLKSLAKSGKIKITK